MKRILNKRAVTLLVCLILIFTVTVGISLAHILARTNSRDNTFIPGRVSCAVVENRSDSEHTSGQVTVPTDPSQGNAQIKRNVMIKNTGNVDAYIRVAIVVTWKASDGTVYAKTPVLGTDYSMALDLQNGWFEGSDGYYYYSSSVAPNGGLTSVLIPDASQRVPGPIDTEGRQYYLSIEIVASAIQADPAEVVHKQWGVTVTDGKISK